MDPTTNVARMLNSVGSRIWALADGNHSVEHIAQQIQTEYEVSSSEASASVEQFIEELAVKELVIFV